MNSSIILSIVYKLLDVSEKTQVTLKEMMEVVKDHIYKKKISIELLKDPLVMAIIVHSIYAIILLFKGLKYKKISLFPFVTSFFVVLLNPLQSSIHFAFKYIIRNIPSQKPSVFLERLLRDPELFILVFSAVLSISALGFYELLKHIAVFVLASELKQLFLSAFGISLKTQDLLSLICLLFFILISKMVVKIAENILLACIFSINGALLVISSIYIFFGVPQGFLDFVSNAFKWKSFADIKFEMNFVIFLTFALTGFWCQISSNGFKKTQN